MFLIKNKITIIVFQANAERGFVSWKASARFLPTVGSPRSARKAEPEARCRDSDLPSEQGRGMVATLLRSVGPGLKPTERSSGWPGAFSAWPQVQNKAYSPNCLNNHSFSVRVVSWRMRSRSLVRCDLLPSCVLSSCRV